MREFLLTANADNNEIFECALVHLGYTYYRHLSKHEKKSTAFGPQQGQQTMNFELWPKPFHPRVAPICRIQLRTRVCTNILGRYSTAHQSRHQGLHQHLHQHSWTIFNCAPGSAPGFAPTFAPTF